MNIKKTFVATASAIALSVAFSSPVTAGPSYDFAMRLQGQNQINYATAIIKNYQRSMPVYENLVSRYGHYSWAASFKKRLEMMQQEVKLLQSIIDAQEEVATEVGKETVWGSEFDVVQKGTERLVDTRIQEVEEEADGIVRVYQELTQMFEREDTVRRYRGRVIYTIYSNGERVPHVTPLLLSTSNRVEKRQENERKFLREYAVVVPEETDPSTVNGTPTTNVLTAAEYQERDDVMLSGTQTYYDAVQNTYNGRVNPDYITRESGLAPYGNSLDAIGVVDAWSRGWTGKGSVMAILDGGIDQDHSEFAGRILASECFTSACSRGFETVDDNNRVSHGTHVAGIAGAAFDGEGTTGVAPDAQLLIGKVGFDSGYVEMSKIPTAIDWAVGNGADVINISANFNPDGTYRNSVESIDDGVFFSTDQRGRNGNTFSNSGFMMLMADPMLPDWQAAMTGHESVLVMSAGNQRLGYSSFPAHWAIAEDEDGELLFDGRAMVVGNWDVRTNQLASSSNAAGTMCFEKNDNGTCANDRRISDWYIMAPGQNVASTDNQGEYRTNSGTSQAAPMVTGGVALIHQMWPHMKGENIVQLLLNTADKTISGYDENIHGQGLMDLSEATSPQGAIGIPTTGRVDGTTTALGGMNIAGANIGAISSLMVVDDYDRDFYVDGNELNNSSFTGPQDYMSMTSVSIPGEDFNVNFDERNFGVSAEINNWTLGATIESETFLGNYANNALIDVDGAQTVYAGYNWTQTVGETKFFAGATVGLTNLNVNSGAMMHSADVMVSNSAKVGFQQQLGFGTLSFDAALPVGIVSGDGKFNVASSVSSSGDIQTTSMEGSLANRERPVQLGINWSVTF
jgi:hypothetical protein